MGGSTVVGDQYLGEAVEDQEIGDGGASGHGEATLGADLLDEFIDWFNLGWGTCKSDMEFGKAVEKHVRHGYIPFRWPAPERDQITGISIEKYKWQWGIGLCGSGKRLADFGNLLIVEFKEREVAIKVGGSFPEGGEGIRRTVNSRKHEEIGLHDMKIWIIGKAMGHKVATVSEIGGKSVETDTDAGTTEVGQNGRTAGEEFHVNGGINMKMSDFIYGGNCACEKSGNATGANNDDILRGDNAKGVKDEAVFFEDQKKYVLIS